MSVLIRFSGVMLVERVVRCLPLRAKPVRKDSGTVCQFAYLAALGRVAEGPYLADSRPKRLVLVKLALVAPLAPK